MNILTAKYTPRRFDKASLSIIPVPSEAITVLIVKICNPTKDTSLPRIVFVDSNGKLKLATMDCFSECKWEEESQTQPHRPLNCPKCGGYLHGDINTSFFVCGQCGWEGYVKLKIK